MDRQFFVFCMCFFMLVSCTAKRSSQIAQPDMAGRTKATQKPYTVLGKRYEPLRSHERFVQTGLASWYGKDFHGKKTSNGETYNMYSMTAAHKTLPLGVFVKVYNAKNGRETIVRINDRGPFVKGRIIDLSYAAAKKLDIHIAGTAFVKIEALGYKQEDSSVGAKTDYRSPATYDSGIFSVQIGSFKESVNAHRLSDEMQKRYGFSDVRKFILNGEVFYRVYAGKYTSLEAAEKAEKTFSDVGYPGCFTVSLD
jgi:rare lipoprotein A